MGCAPWRCCALLLSVSNTPPAIVFIPRGQCRPPPHATVAATRLACQRTRCPTDKRAAGLLHVVAMLPRDPSLILIMGACMPTL